MKLKMFLLFLIIFLVACSEQDYEKDDVVAILNEKEIKIEDILWLYSLEENTEERIIGYLKLEVLIQEAKNIGITITEEEIEDRKLAIFPKSTASERFEESDNKEFLEKQASILGVTPEKYFEVWEDNSHRAGAYIVKYVFEIFDEPNDAEHIQEIEAWDQKVNEHIDDLFQRYKDEGKLIIN